MLKRQTNTQLIYCKSMNYNLFSKHYLVILCRNEQSSSCDYSKDYRCQTCNFKYLHDFYLRTNSFSFVIVEELLVRVFLFSGLSFFSSAKLVPLSDVDKFFVLLIINGFVLLPKVKSVDISQFLSVLLCHSVRLCYLCMANTLGA